MTYLPLSDKRSYRRWFALIPMGFAGLWFYLLEKLAPAPRYLLHARLDDAIPYISAFILPYVLWYFTCTAMGLALFFLDEDEFIRFASYIAGGMLIACFIYTFWPNGQNLRPDLTAATGPFNAMVRVLYAIDTPTNSSPSIHVTYAVGTLIAFNRVAHRRKKRPLLAWVSLGVTVAIVLSTVFVKQHSVICVVWGLLLSAFLATAIYGRDTVRVYRAAKVRKLRGVAIKRT